MTPLTEDWLTKFGFHAKYKSVHNQWHRCYGAGVLIGNRLRQYDVFYIQQKSDVDDDNNSIPQEEKFYYIGPLHDTLLQVDVETVEELRELYLKVTKEELQPTNDKTI